MKNHHFFLIIGLLIGLSLIMPIVSALPAGFQEFYLPLQTSITQDSFTYVNRAALEEKMTYVVGVTASADNTVVYYDHWENGLKSGTDADEVVRLSKGQVYVFRSNNIPTNPRGTGTYYDGGDRIFVSGSLLQLVVSTWPSDTGTVLSDAWEVYPVKAWNTQYVVPVGEDIGAGANYIDFAKTTIQVMSGTNGNSVTFTPPSGAPTTITLNRGQASSYTVAKAGTTISATSPIQVQIIAGDNKDSKYSMRGYTITPRQYWGTSYYAPVPSWSNANSDLFLYNPNSAPITVNYETRTGSGSFTVAAGKTKSFFEATGAYIPQNSGAYLSSGSVFWGIASCDTKSSLRDWAYSLIPATMLGTDNYVSWAPGTSDTPPKNNGSPVYITATTDGTTVYAYYSPDDGVPDRTFTLDRLQSVEIYDTDNDNSGMHIVSTAPVAMAWGESPKTAGTGSPYLDMGYTTLPLPIEWIDVALNIEKTADPTQIRVGGESTFTLNISVPGTAGAPITNLSVVDKLPPGWEYVPESTKLDGTSYPNPTPITGNLSGGYKLTWNLTGTLDPNTNRNITFRALSTSSVNSNYPNRNVASVTGNSLGATLTADSDAFVTFDNSLPGIKITKNGPASARIGEEIRYTFNVTNTGNLSLSNITVNDPMLGGNITGPVSGDVNNDGVLNASEVWQYTRNYTVKADDPNPLVNTAMVTGDYKGISTSDVDDHTVTLTIAPGIDLNKSGPVSARVGEEITYTFNVTNTGNVPLSNVTVNDPMLGGNITGPVSGDVDNDGVLNLTEVWQYTRNYTVKAGDPNPLVNNATATGDYQGKSVTDSDPFTMPLDIAPGINLEKSGPRSAQIGDLITYTFNVTNTGNVPLSNVTINDPLPGLSTITGPTGDNGDQILNRTEVWQYTATYTVRENDPDPLINNATATGDFQGISVNNTDSSSVPFDLAPGINLAKTGPASARIGEEITYNFTVTNTGNTPLSNVTVNDPMLGGTITGPASGDDGNDGVLNLTEVWQYTKNYTVKAGDPNPLVNNATATGSYKGQSVSDSDPYTLTLDIAPGINLEKSGPRSANISEAITYTFTVTNTGNVPLSNVTVNDPLQGLSAITGPTGDEGSDQVLKPGEVWQYTATYTVPAGASNPLVNTATATGDYRGESVTHSDQDAVPLNLAPGINIAKTGPASARIGEAITYTFTVRNNGNVPLSNVTVNDPMLGGNITGPASGDVGNDGVLNLTEVWVYTTQYTVKAGDSNPLVNTARVTGDYQGEAVTDSDQYTLLLDIAPGINLAKSGPSSARIGEEITYTFTVTNSGNVPLSNVTINDPLPGLSAITGPTGDNGDQILNTSEVWQYTATYTVKTGDPNPLVNNATANGDYQGEGVSDSDPFTIPLDIAPGIKLDKSGPASAMIGEEITYTFTVMNSGNVPLSNVTVSDPMLGGTIAGPASGDNGDHILDTTEAWTYTANYTVKENDPNPLVNTATAKGDYQGNSTDTDSFAVILNLAPGINLAKSGPKSAAIGEEITYTFTVTNTGNVPLSSVTVNDPMLGGIISGPASGDDGNDGVLNLNEVWQYTRNYTVKASDPNPLVNNATATGSYKGQSVSDSDPYTLTLNLVPGIKIVKSGPSSAQPGENITYTFTVTNTGNLPLSNVTVSDPMLGGTIAGPASGDDGNDGVLNLNEVWQYTSYYTIKAGDPNPLINRATAEGDYQGTHVTDTSDHTVNLSIGPGIGIVKSGPASALIGQEITYTFNVTNTGNVPLSNVTVNDPMLGGIIAGPASGDNGDRILNTNEVWVYTAKYTIPAGVTNPLMNTATAEGDYTGTHVTNTGEHTVNLTISPAINLTKSGPINAEIGGFITYTFIVRNPGNVPLSNVKVNDPLLGGIVAGPVSGDVGNDGVLNPGEVWQYTANYRVPIGAPNPLVNTASVTGDYGTSDYTDNAQHSTPITNPVPTTIPTTNATTAQTTVPTTNATTIPTTNATTAQTTIPTTNATTIPTTNATTAQTTIPTTNATTAQTTIPTTNATTIPTTNATTAQTTIPATNATTIPTTNATTAQTTIPATNATTVTTTKTPVTTTATTAPTTATTTKTPVTTTATTAPTTVTTTKTPVTTTATTAPTTATTTKTPVTTTATTIPTTNAPTTAVPTTEPTFIDIRPGTTTPATAVTTTAVTATTVPTTVKPATAVPTAVKPTTAVPTTVTPTPTVISQPGSYQIDKDVRNTTTPVWILVTVSNVTIDGGGHTIDGTDADGSYGILVRGDGLLSNITITNVTITDFAYGIGLYNVTNSRIIGVNTSSNTYDGIIIVGGGNNTLADNIIHQDDDGIYLKGTNMTLVTNNTVTENVRGSGIHLSDNCDQVDLINNTIRGNDEGIEVEEASNSTIRTNWITTSRYFGLNLTTALNLTVADNYINNSVNVIAQNGTRTGVWNLPATAATNVIGNTYTGGNYWGTPNGTGFSDTAADLDGDGFTNSIYQIPGGIGTDRLPLSPTSYLLKGADRPFPVPVNSSLEAPLTSRATDKPDPWAGLRKLYPIGGLFRL